MKDAIAQAVAKASQAFSEAKSLDELEQLRIQYLGKKGEITSLSRGLKDVPKEDRPAVGQSINEAKEKVNIAFSAAKTRLEEEQSAGGRDRIDVTLPGRRQPLGNAHPIIKVWREIEQIFMGMGFTVEDGPEIESEYYNFDALNFPSNHPARDEQDTLFVEGGMLLRTHTSPVQVRVMQRQKPPVRMICPGWVYRNDPPDATHSPMFSQIEGLVVDRRITFAHLKGVLNEFVRQFYGKTFRTRFRPHFFPFTEPSAEMDVQCFNCGGDGQVNGHRCRVCKGSGWIEILGCGMVDVNVFKAVGYDPEEVTGFAFGMGIERITMFRYGIDEIRNFFDGDVRFLRQF